MVGAVDLLAEENRLRPDPALAARLVDLRLRAGREALGGGGREPWPPPATDPFPEAAGRLPEIDRTDLGEAVLTGAVRHHGALVVRGLFSPDRAERVVGAIDDAHAARRRRVEGGSDADEGSYRPVPAEPRVRNQVLRNVVAEQGGIWLADSPGATATVLDALHEVGAVDVMTAHFGERPLFSLQKSTLRRSEPVRKMVAWHQDGSFLAPDVRTMNVWVALTACGGDLPTPGLEVFPRRFDEVLPVAGDPTPHAVDFALAAQLAEETPTVVPSFAPGDALLFDHHLLHRTHLPEAMTDPRYALECWFFAPSHHTPDYVPLLA